MQHESDNKREVDKLIARAGAIDLDNDKLMHALANQRCMTGGKVLCRRRAQYFGGLIQCFGCGLLLGCLQLG